MSEKYLCPRLADYLVIVGSRTPQHSAIQPPELLRRYPLEDHKDFPLPIDVVYFCQPEGCVSAGPKRPALRDAVSFVFMLTDKDSGRTRYGVCLNFYRRTERTTPPSSGARRKDSDGNPTIRRQSWRKSLEKSSDSAFSSDQRSGIAPSDSEREVPSRRDSSDTTTTATNFHPTNPFFVQEPPSPAPTSLGLAVGDDSASGGSKSPSPALPPPLRPSGRRRQRSKNHSLTSICLLSHHPFFSSFRQCLTLLKKLIDACNDNTSPHRVGASKLSPRDSLWSVLTGRNTDIGIGSSIVAHDVREIETWILRLLSCPVPVPGSTRVELEVLPPELHPPLVFALPDKTRFSLTDFPLHLPLELLGVDSCLQVLTLIFLECKVVIQSRDYSALSMSVLALVTMLYPLEYMFPVIPLLPTCMSCAEQLLLAPTPFIIGIPASFLPYKKHFRLPDDIWLVDLDANKITGPKSVEKDSCDFIPTLPEPEASVLRSHLKQAMGRMDLQVTFTAPPIIFHQGRQGVEQNALASMSSAPIPPENQSDTSSIGGRKQSTDQSSSSSSVIVPSSIPQKAQQQIQSSQGKESPVPPTSLHGTGQVTQQGPSRSPTPSRRPSPGSSTSPQSITSIPPTTKHQSPNVGAAFNPLIYGNDVDSVDVATRIAMVRFFNSANILANFSEHTRTLRLYPRPVVAFQISSFLRSRPQTPSQFLCRFARTQAVEYLAEWSLAPTNLAFLRIQTGVYDPAIIGDKAKWFANSLQPITFNIHVDVPGLCSVLINSRQVSAAPTDESGSDSDGGGSGDSTSSYSSLSDFVSELASSDLSAAKAGIIIAQKRKPHGKHHHHHHHHHHRQRSHSQEIPDQEHEQEIREDEEFFPNQQAHHDDLSRNITQLCSSLDLSTVYNPPLALLLPGDTLRQRKMSASGSGSGSDSESSASSGAEDVPTSRRHSRESRKSSGATQISAETSQTEQTSAPIPTPAPLPQHILGKEGGGITRQGSFGSGSIFGHFASQAKELVKETKRQSSQEGLLSKVDQLKTKTKEKLTEAKVKHGSMGSSGDETSFLSPLEHLTSQAKKKAGEAGKSVQASLSKTALDEFAIAGKSTWDDITKSAKKGLLKSLGESSEFKDKESPAAELSRKQSVERRDSTSSIASRILVPQIKGDVVLGRNSSREFFANMSSELNGLASQTTSMFSDFFGNNNSGVGPPNRNSVSACPSPNRASSPAPSLTGSTNSLPTTVHSSGARDTTNQHHSPFPTGRKGLVERSSLIRHTTSHLHPQKPKTDFKMIQKLSGNQGSSNTGAENAAFLAEVTNQVLNGEGVGWLRVGRLKKIFEDESFRVMTVAKTNKTLDRKIGPDDHIDDVCIPKPVWKGMLKLLQLLVSGLEYSYANRGLGGMASAFQVLEIAHTHYWTKDLSDMTESHSHSQFLDPNVLSPGILSMQGSPAGSEQGSPEPSRRPSHASPAHATEHHDPASSIEQHPTPTHAHTSSTSDVFRDIFQSKKQSLMSRLSSSECHIEGVPDQPSAPGGGSVVVNPVINPSWSQLGASSLTKPRLASRLSQMSLRSTVSDTELEQGSGRGKRSPSVWSSKSALAAGLRYHAGSLIPTGSSPTSPENGRMYIFEGLVKERSSLWDQMQFWEDAFLDAVAQERELVGMDQGPREMMERYQSLSDSEKKRLEHEEDRLLATQLYNLVSFMLMMDVNRTELKQKIRRLLGKSHMGLVYSQEINQLLEQVNHLRGNAVDLKPAGSRLAHRQTFAVHAGAEPIGDLLFMEVRDDGLVLRNVAGAIVERWWWERLVNMTYSPKTKVLCLWRRIGGQTQLHKYHSRKCRQLYQAIKEAMERAAARGSTPLPGTDLGGEFPVEDMKTGQGGLLQVCMEGVGLLFANSKDFEFFVRLDHIRKCFTQKGGIFVLEEFNPKTRQVLQRKYKSALAENICYSVLCVFSYVAAGHEQKKAISTKGAVTPTSTVSAPAMTMSTESSSISSDKAQKS